MMRQNLMAYPPAPWQLQGYAIQTLHLVEIDRIRSLIPPQLEIVAVLPGKTLGSIYISEYQSGSVLTYNELIVAPALVKHHRQVGGWISHIYVDNLDSVAGGREIWGLPKEMAEFNRSQHQIVINQQDLTLCNLSVSTNIFSGLKLQPKITGYCFGNLHGELLYFGNDFKAKISSIDSNLEIPQTSPFAHLKLSQAFLTIDLQELQLVAGIPAHTGTQLVQLSTVS
jgi:acetoacetate decarboxylase